MFEVTARMKIRNGDFNGFEQRAAEMMRLTRELDTQTLRYDWFLSADRTACEVREGYVEADGLFEHNAHVREARDLLFRDHAYGHDMTIYDKPSPALAELMERIAGHVVFNRFSLLRALDAHEGGGTAMFEATAHLRIRDGRLDEFKQQVAELARHAAETTTEQPLRYDWFLNDKGTECEVREAYVDADALLRYQQTIAQAKMKLFRECVESHTMTFYGALSPALTGALQAMGTSYTVFSFLQGLDADIRVLDEVTA